MPFSSPAQRRYIYAQARAGVPWAIKFIKDSGGTPPPVSMAHAVSKAVARRRQARK